MKKIKEGYMFKIVILVIVLLLNFVFSFNAYADYICEVCYNPPIGGVACETLGADTLNGVYFMLMTAMENVKGKLKRVTIDCSFPVGEPYRGYKAVIDLK